MTIHSWRLRGIAALSLLLAITGTFLFFRPTNASALAVDLQARSWEHASGITQQEIQNAAPVPDPHALTQLTQDASQARKHKIATIPFWSSSFDYQGATYPFSMVGKDPAKGSSLSVVPVFLIPIKLVLADGSVYDGSTKADAVADSPLFRFAQFDSGFTQYGDAIQRAEFWNSVSTKSPFYHVWLAPPLRFPTLTLNVPADEGQLLTLRSGKVVAGVDINYLDDQFQQYMATYHISPWALPIFLTANTFGLDGGACCIGGYHSAVENSSNTAIQTYVYAEYGDLGLSTTNPTLFANTDALSHELAEWLNDPFTNNETPAWSVPSQPQYGCSQFLETGDPLVGVGFNVNGYHLQDEAFFSWFARQNPSIGIDGKYSYLGSFDTFSPGC
ncbi:MAG TPA: hypothetical protein VFB60_09495 [Ktedonobacteraceae bacterium]|nr:hypothetical protein [Ktedonobacteraceae bacterium]